MDDDIVKIPRRAIQQFRKDPEKMLAFLDIATGEYVFTIRTLAAEWGWPLSKAQRFMKTVNEYLGTDTKPIHKIRPGGILEGDDQYKTDTGKLKRKTAPPNDFPITDKMRAWIFKNFGVVSETDVLYQTEQFLDHWRGKGELRLDWVASWRTWIRNWRTKFGTVTRKPDNRGGGRPWGAAGHDPNLVK